MGMTEEDAWREEAYDQMVEEILETHRDVADVEPTNTSIEEAFDQAIKCVETAT